jgi:sugar O-acyltransferase (sialic acid O-acetyltransferase NeuD family)
MSSVVIVGAGGHTRTLINILELQGIQIEGIYDEVIRSEGEQILGYSVKPLAEIPKELAVIVSKGDVEGKVKYSNLYLNRIVAENLIHPKANIESTLLGTANQISSNCYITPTAKIGSHNVIYSGTIIEHESIIGDYSIVTVNVSICGRSKIGNNCFIGAGAVVLPNVSICDHAIIGAGAVVTKDILSPGTYVGAPAKLIQP